MSKLVVLDWPPPNRCPSCDTVLPCAACGEPHEPRKKWPKSCAKKATHRLATATRSGWRCDRCATREHAGQPTSDQIAPSETEN